MEPLAAFPDVEVALMQRLELLSETTGTYLPDDLKTRMPFIFIQRYGGSDDRLTDTAVVGVDIYAPTRSVGRALAESVRQVLTATPYAVAAGVVDTVTTAEAPHEVPYGDSAIRHWVSSYTVTLRR